MHKLFISYKISRRYLLTLAIFIVCNHILAQKSFNAKDAYNEAESDFLYEEYSEALPLYTKLKDQSPDNFFLDYRIGRCYLNLPYNRSKALAYLERAAKHISPNIKKEAQWKEKLSPLDVIFYLGDAYRINNDLNKAIQSYTDFKKRGNNVLFDYPLIDHHIQSCLTAIEMMKNPIDMNEDNLGPIVNSRYPKSNPVVSEDESTLVYSATLPFYEAMFYSKRVNGVWTEPYNMIPDLGVDGDCHPTSISSDGKELYIYRKDDEDGNLYVTNFKNGRWTKIRKLNGNINTKYWESHASVSHNGLTLYFTSNRAGGNGDLDIYKSVRSATTNDNWGTAINLGPEVNSKYNEDAPFISADEKHLFFSSFGHKTMGGFDIFRSDLLANGKWSEPVNMGYPVNSTDDDIFYCPVRNGTVAYLCKYDPKGYGKSDIIRCEIFSDANPRQYIVNTRVLFPDNIANTDNLYLAIYDKTKKDTVVTRLLKKDKTAIQIPSGNYTVVLKSPGMQSQVVPLTIAKRLKEKEVLVNASMSAQTSSVTAKPVSNQVVSTGSSIAGSSKAVAAIGIGKQTEAKPVPNGNSNGQTSAVKETGKNTSIDSSTNKAVTNDTLAQNANDRSIAKTPMANKPTAKASGKPGTSSQKNYNATMVEYAGYAAILLTLLLLIFIVIRIRKKSNA
jgi:tetratricopeptide (TPR) repeat protein